VVVEDKNTKLQKVEALIVLVTVSAEIVDVVVTTTTFISLKDKIIIGDFYV